MGGQIRRVFVPFTEEEKGNLEPIDFDNDGMEENGRWIPDLIHLI